MVITGISRDISQLQILPCQEKDSQEEIVATPRMLQLVLWDPIGSECFSWDCETFFNLARGIYPETTHFIQDGSSPSLFRDQESYLLPILEYNPFQAVLALKSCPEKSHPQKLNFGGVH